MSLSIALPIWWVQRLTMLKCFNVIYRWQQNKHLKLKRDRIFLIPLYFHGAENSVSRLQNFLLCRIHLPATSWLIAPFAVLQKISNYHHNHFETTQHNVLLSLWKTGAHRLLRKSERRAVRLPSPEREVWGGPRRQASRPPITIPFLRMRGGLQAASITSPDQSSGRRPHPARRMSPFCVHGCNFQKVLGTFVHRCVYLSWDHPQNLGRFWAFGQYWKETRQIF